MATNLLEKYSKRISAAATYYSRKNDGKAMSAARKVVLAECLENTSKYLNEQFNSSMATQRSDINNFKTFCLTLLNAALPNLIIEDIMAVHPIDGMNGFAPYVEYVSGPIGESNGFLMNRYDSHGVMDEVRMGYTGERVVEHFTGDGTTTAFDLGWAPVLDGSSKLADGFVMVDGSAVTAYTVSGSTLTFTSAPANTKAIRIGFLYDNQTIPQDHLPILKAVMHKIDFQCKVERLAIYYSQLAAYQAKADYNLDLEKELPKQAIAELQYVIDSKGVQMLSDGAEADADLTFSKTLPVGVSQRDHFASFGTIIEMANAKVFNRTQRLSCNYMITDALNIPVIAMVPGWAPASRANINGPYKAGSVNGVDVYVSPVLAGTGEFVLGVHSTELNSSAAVYAPWLPVIPTQLLGFADGGMSQGFSTVYDMKLLSTYEKGGKIYSNLLVKGVVTA